MNLVIFLSYISGALARESRGTPWVRKLSYLPIRKNLVTTSGHSLEVREGNHSVSPSGEEYVMAEVEFFISSTSLVSAVNNMAARAFRAKKTKKKRVFLSIKF